MLKPNSSLMVTLQNRETKMTYRIHYIVGDLILSVQDDNFYYGIGMPTTWKHITRDLLTDLTKGIQASAALSNAAAAANANHVSPTGEKSKRKHRRTDIKVIEIALLGAGAFDNITLSTNEHIAQFYDAAEWFVRHQDPKTGGWPNPVKRKLSEFAELKAGWYSAMGQGHAISLLARAYYHSKGDMRYLRAAINGIKPFRVPSRQGGVLAKFLGKFDWWVDNKSVRGLNDLINISLFQVWRIPNESIVVRSERIYLFTSGTVWFECYSSVWPDQRSWPIIWSRHDITETNASNLRHRLRVNLRFTTYHFRWVSNFIRQNSLPWMCACGL